MDDSELLTCADLDEQCMYRERNYIEPCSTVLMLSPNINSLIYLSHLFKFSFIKKYSRLFVPLLSILYWKKLIVIYVLNEPLMLNLSILFVHTQDMVLLHVPIVLLTTSALTYSNISNYCLQGLTKILQKTYNVKFVLQNIILIFGSTSFSQCKTSSYSLNADQPTIKVNLVLTSLLDL